MQQNLVETAKAILLKGHYQQLTAFVPAEHMHPAIWQVIRHRSTMPAYKAMDHGKIRAYRQEYGLKSTVGALMLFLLDLATAFKVGSNLSEDEAADIARMLTDNYFYLSMAEFAVFCEQAKAGRYGKIFNRFDRAVFFEMLEQYLDEREGYLRDKRVQENSYGLGSLFKAMLEQAPETYAMIKQMGQPKKPVFDQPFTEQIRLYPDLVKKEIIRENKKYESRPLTPEQLELVHQRMKENAAAANTAHP